MVEAVVLATVVAPQDVVGTAGVVPPLDHGACVRSAGGEEDCRAGVGLPLHTSPEEQGHRTLLVEVVERPHHQIGQAITVEIADAKPVTELR